jgi:hypothetical protein
VVGGFFGEPSYDVPLALAVVLVVGLVWWSLVRTDPLPVTSPKRDPGWWARRRLPYAYLALEEGRYFATLYGLWQRLATVVMRRFYIGLDQKNAFDNPGVTKVLRPPLTLRLVMEDLTRAYYSAFWADEPSWAARHWSWLRRRQQRRAARDFAKAVRDLAVVFPLLEGAE